MKRNPSIVRRVRKARQGSEQLAAAAGLGLRTVQHVEADGVASRGTRVCLAAALDTDVSAMLDAGPSPSPSPVAAARWQPWMLRVMAGVPVFAAGTTPGGAEDRRLPRHPAGSGRRAGAFAGALRAAAWPPRPLDPAHAAGTVTRVPLTAFPLPASR